MAKRAGVRGTVIPDHGAKELKTGTVRAIVSAAGVYLPEGRHPIIPIFHHSIIPIAERGGAKFFTILRFPL
jgi:hypothetical protein